MKVLDHVVLRKVNINHYVQHHVNVDSSFRVKLLRLCLNYPVNAMHHPLSSPKAMDGATYLYL
jgi:hypothetical protein